MSNSRTPVPLLTEALVFPAPELAGPEGLLAVGGDLRPERLLLAYRMGIFPWFNEDSLILWWSPDPRMVLYPEELKISKSMRSVIRKGRFQVTRNRDFAAVVSQCARTPRKDQEGTWITERMEEAYLELHKRGHAVSYEVWEEGTLVGGLYGVELGHVFCGESMFSTTSNASKVGFIHMVQEQQKKGCVLIDCQIHSDHLESLGAREIPRAVFLEQLAAKDC
ncbi:leucyl/phenylalanyl-tRNA--protein transferase [Robiginitalea myxolifaciens]|uniref:Leucyl/phenylalanyl-tRNA--protein transferase n=1 Tax=Robiginitalea myxolifaciens TaxID=400055 RepID=A0A1I6G866_9FLAO|nr:leucyl/phenylalanyl-tRNA--protein transferase [Robiginitalea myxolifaciens]SFR38398.1 leucyl/phenylalanyl-tRNA--protein transferase [Robiginitalea myxolifaciens]